MKLTPKQKKEVFEQLDLLINVDHQRMSSDWQDELDDIVDMFNNWDYLSEEFVDKLSWLGWEEDRISGDWKEALNKLFKIYWI